MLASLYIKNIAVIEEVSVDFYGGFEVLTGETGAGKSILIDSLNLVLGAKAQSGIIRNGAESAYVRAMFYCQNAEEFLSAEGIDIQSGDGEILLERTIFKNGRNVSKINGMAVNTSKLLAVSKYLISIHGQRDNAALLNDGAQLLYLDEYGKISPIREEYTKLFHEYNKISGQIENLKINEAEKNEKSEFLKYRINEIDAARLVIGEEEELREKRSKVLSKQKIINGLSAAYALMYENDENAYLMLSKAASFAGEAAEATQEAVNIRERIEELCVLSKDVASDVMELLQKTDEIGENISEIEERLNLITELKRKFSMSVEEILELKGQMEEELLKIENSAQYILKLEEEKQECFQKTQAAAKKLTKERKIAAQSLGKAISKELLDLDMEKVRFEVLVEDCEYKKTGADNCIFLVSTNPGEDLKPVSKIASGGELSRIMLAVKSVLSEDEEGKTYIFDEIDSGVSGRAAQKTAQKLRLMGKNRQVLAITHLPQLASMGNHHFLIEKKSDENSTKTSVSEISGEERIKEIARIIGGVKITDLTLENAKQMLILAEED